MRVSPIGELGASRIRALVYVTFAAFFVAAAVYVFREYQRARMKVTMTRMRNVGAAIEAYELHPGTCEEVRRIARSPAIDCTSAKGDPILVRSTPGGYVVWTGAGLESQAPFVLQDGRFLRLPANAPP